MIDPGDREYLARQLERGRAILFTGAGFSSGSCDVQGKPIARGSGEAAEELWQLCFPGEPRDSASTLQDLFEIALSRHRSALTAYLSSRFQVDPKSLPEHYAPWLAAPWLRVYTLNVDDLEIAAARRFTLPREPRSLSALAPTRRVPGLSGAEAAVLEVIHLNGRASDGPEAVTFGVTQYARRVGGTDPYYPQLVSELVSHPVVFVGTVLEEPALWQHIELRGLRGARESRELRPRSFLITPTLSRARAALLQSYNVHWVKASAEEFAAGVLLPLDSRLRTAVTRVGASAARSTITDSIPLVADLVSAEPPSKSLYLLGDQPRWSDITDGLAIPRESDREILQVAKAALQADSATGTLLLLSGTAGAGKSTALKRLALRLGGEGEGAGWVDDSIEVGPRTLERFRSHEDARVLFVDNAERYGTELAAVVRSLLEEGGLKLLVLGMRAAQVERRLSGHQAAGLLVREIPIPPLADSDIDGLLAALERNNLLGRLTGLPYDAQRAAFREKADRQLLVAMIEATSGRRFEEKVFEEWEELTAHEKEAYGLVALAFSMGHSIDREQVLIASGESGNEVLNAVEGLVRRHILRDEAGKLRARHSLVAEVLLQELQSQLPALVLRIYSRLAFAAAVRVRPTDPRSSRPWRLLKAILSHDRLYRRFDYSGASAVYDEVADVLGWDYHYYLQRGSLELEYGQPRLAENFLESARSLESRDPKVITAYAYMLLKKAITGPESPSALSLANQGIDLLLEQIDQRGDRDSYPFHVLGSQGLAWSRRARMSDREREALYSLLISKVAEGSARHPRQADLRQLLADLRREDLSRAVRPR